MLLINSMAAFALAKYDFRGRGTVFVLIIATLMIPPTIVLVPTFLVVSELGPAQQPWGVIWPGAATPTGVFLLRQYMLTIPDELIDAARMDHASEWRIYWRIVLPLTAPALAVLAIFSIMWRWNEFLWPLIVLTRSEQFTLQLALNSFQGELSDAVEQPARDDRAHAAADHLRVRLPAALHHDRHRQRRASSEMATVELDRHRQALRRRQVIHGVDLAVADGEFCVFVGPSGCGKSTLLRMIAGLEDDHAGEIRIDGQRVNERRRRRSAGSPWCSSPTRSTRT